MAASFFPIDPRSRPRLGSDAARSTRGRRDAGRRLRARSEGAAVSESQRSFLMMTARPRARVAGLVLSLGMVAGLSLVAGGWVLHSRAADAPPAGGAVEPVGAVDDGDLTKA